MDLTESRYQVGQRLHHPQFGDGLIVEVHTDRGREVLEVVFDGQLRRLSAQREWEVVSGNAGRAAHARGTHRAKRCSRAGAPTMSRPRRASTCAPRPNAGPAGRAPTA